MYQLIAAPPVYCRSVSSIQPRVCVSLRNPLELSGDVLIKLYNKGQDSRETLCRVQFNTSVVSGDKISLGKQELDVAATGNGR